LRKIATGRRQNSEKNKTVNLQGYKKKYENKSRGSLEFYWLADREFCGNSLNPALASVVAKRSELRQ
jgi:hypothetical protein